MVAETEMMIRHAARRFSYTDACNLAQRVTASSESGSILLDLERATETTTAALARLVLLRRNLLRAGRDLRIAGLSGRAKCLYEICRLSRILPQCGVPGANTSRRC